MLSFVISGFGCAFAGLCYAEFAALIPLAGSAYTYAYAALGELFAWIIGWDLTLEYAMGASTVSSGWSNHFVEFLDIFGLQHAALARLRPLDRASNRRKHRRPADGFMLPTPASPSVHQAFLARVGDIIAAQSPELIQRAHDLVNAPHLFGMEIGFNLPAFLIALIITAILVRGNSRKALPSTPSLSSSKSPSFCSSSASEFTTSISATGDMTGPRSPPWESAV